MVHYPIHDFNEQNLIDRLEEGATELYKLIKAKKIVYVHCTAGMGRAPAIVVMYLYLYENMSPDDAYYFVHE